MTPEQTTNAALIADVARAMGLPERAALLGVMCAIGESSLVNIDYGDWETNGVRNPDGTPTSSIGLFQQQSWWGSVADRMDPLYSAWAFFNALTKVKGWEGMAPTLAIHRVQINADPNHYARFESAARAVLADAAAGRAKGTIMADPLEVIEVPWQKGMFGRRALVEALDRAGRPRINSMHRTYGQQKEFWVAYQNGTGSPADNPDRPDLFELGHVRGIAADIDATADNVRRLTAAGLVRPFSWESWHWRLPGSVQKYPLMFSIPSVAGGGDTPITKDWFDMATANDLRAVVREEIAREIKNTRTNEHFIVSYASQDERNGIVIAGYGYWHKLTAEEWEHFNWLQSNGGLTIFAGLHIFTPINDRSYDILKAVCLGDGVAEGEGGVTYEQVKQLMESAPPLKIKSLALDGTTPTVGLTE